MTKMNEDSRRLWTEEEEILALDLYCRIPFGLISSKNPDIVHLAALIDRTPGAVSMKLSNLARLDPTLNQRGIHGLQNGSILDEKVFSDFLGILIFSPKKLMNFVRL